MCICQNHNTSVPVLQNDRKVPNSAKASLNTDVFALVLLAFFVILLNILKLVLEVLFLEIVIR